MNLQELYPTLRQNVEILGITANSKRVRKNYIFVAIKGNTHNGKKYIKEALDNGAYLIVTDQMVLKNYNHIRVRNAKSEYIRLLQAFYHYDHEIYTVGITGTDGKTTTANILNQIFDAAKSSAYIGTNGISYLKKNIKTKHTTPTPDLFYEAYSVLKKHHINDLVMEVSSEGILDGRIEKLTFDGAIFTNLSHEHLNTHKTMENYFKTKAKLFEELKPGSLAVINSDDFYGAELAGHTKARAVTYGLDTGIYQAKNIKLGLLNSEFDVYFKGLFLEHFKLPLFGKYNVYNALAAIAYASELGIDLKYIKQGIESLLPIDGRFMHFKNKKQITGIVDFAHTPNALQNLLGNILEFKKGKVISILGAQGEKDKSKRAQMGTIAARLSDITIFTSEDPKHESLFGILYDLTKELQDKEYYLTLSRKEAITLAAKLAQPNDIIVITGKGNETSEQIYDFHFKHNDYTLLKNALDA
ncbi:MAG: UDP-N-acetylmuramoyl-L-alanyl-D-glutamate--2,6-diaminopimelate ligase [Anaeroplasmataceae bacterium]|nr:UDP-N-acetylmuramoyl-L-alanyl-D-glutamate--2,6-diaminopimelate ligase [Anaeroplasmataceae bacterium]